MSNIKELIRQEIERRKKRWMFDDLPIAMGRYYEDRDLLAFIDSLPEEKPSEDLEEAAKEYATTHLRNNEFPTADSAFIAGAEWQKAKDDEEIADLMFIAALDAGQRARESSEQLPRYYGD